MDKFTKEKRSEIMSLIRGKGNLSTELKLIGLMRERKISGWRRGSNLPGHPDFVFPRARLAVFVDGCFWHGCPKHCRLPKTNKKFWHTKIDRNKRRDRAVTRKLKSLDWRVMRIWAHALDNKSAPRTITRLLRNLALNETIRQKITEQNTFTYPTPESSVLIAAEDE